MGQRKLIPKILVIIPYFGQLPIWIDLFFYSCYKNSFIDFLIYTDCRITVSYSNIKIVNISYLDYCRNVSQKFNVEFQPSNPYKLVDLKPFLGVLHERELKQYDFWGFGDLDLVYGDLSTLLNKRRLRRYDLITTHADRVAGHLTIVKKSSKYTTVCMSFKDKLSDKRIYGLDEVDFSHKVFPLKKYTQWLYNHVGEKLGIYYITFFSFSNFLMRCFTRCYMKEYYTSPAPQNFEQFVYCLKTGLVENHKKLLLPYLHFLFFKKTPYYSPKHFWEGDFYNVPKIKDNMNGYIIFTNKSVSYEENNPHSICI